MSSVTISASFRDLPCPPNLPQEVTCHPTTPASAPAYVVGYPWVFHTVCQSTIHASWLFTACQCPTIPAGFPPWLGKLTCYLNTHASALCIPVDYIAGELAELCGRANRYRGTLACSTEPTGLDHAPASSMEYSGISHYICQCTT